MNPVLAERLATLYPAVAALPAADIDAVLSQRAEVVTVPAGHLLFDEGASCQGFPMVLSGSIRVARASAGGRRLEMYRVTPGEVCVVSASCLFGQSPLSAHGQTLETTELILLDPDGFDLWCRHDAFRRFVFGVFADRLADMMTLAEAVAFQPLEQRLAHALLGHGATVRATHQELADELGTVREIVSRLLSRFERAGWVRMSRERIDVLDALALRKVSTGAAP